jgi:predicted DNA-binding transcriptional regulator YafY
MTATSARTLKLLSILGAGATLTADDLAARLEASVRTVRRDIDTLRDLGYEIEAVRGVGGGYRLGRATRLPPVVFDEDQAVAAAVALQTVPTILSGIHENAARALATLHQAMPARSRLHAEAFTVSTARNYWEFPAPPIDAGSVRAIGDAIKRRHLVRVDYADDGHGGDSGSDGHGEGGHDGGGYRDGGRYSEGGGHDDGEGVEGGEGERVTLTLEPHDLVVWAARWYLVAFDPAADRWRATRVDRLTPRPPTHTPFTRREVPHGDPVAFVMTTHDRGDAAAAWPCRGSAVLALPAATVARFAPGGSTVAHVSATSCRLTLGAWSWSGLAGLLLTFDADITGIEPAELRHALGSLRARIGRGLESG